MSDCENLPGCPFFFGKMEMMPAMAEMFKRNYCLGDNSGCARYMVYRAKGKGQVPPDLYPNDRERAEEIVAGAA